VAAAAWLHQASRGLDGLLRTTAFLTTPADGSVFDAGSQHDVRRFAVVVISEFTGE
jgi:hypothetical protein